MEVPKGWEAARLAQLCEKIMSGGTPRTNVKEYYGGRIGFVKIEDITSAKKYLSSTAIKISDEGLNNSNAWLVPQNSLLLAIYGSLGATTITKTQVATNQAILGMIPKKGQLETEYLYYWFVFSNHSLLRHAKRSTQANLTLEIIENLKIPLPPLPEQSRIALILSTVDEAIQKSDEIIAKMQRLKAGMIHRLLTQGIGHKDFKETEIGKVPKEWDVVRIKELGKIQTGKTPPTKETANWVGPIPFVTPTDINASIYVNYTERKVSTSAAEEVGLLPPKTILVTCIASIGKVALAPTTCVSNQQINSITCNQDYAPEFVYYKMVSIGKKLRANAGIATVPILSKSLFEEIKVGIPPLPEQQRIAEILSSIDQKIELEQKRKAKLKCVKRGLMNDLLTGRKRVRGG